MDLTEFSRSRSPSFLVRFLLVGLGTAIEVFIIGDLPFAPILENQNGKEHGNEMETGLISYRGIKGIVETKMETTVYCYGDGIPFRTPTH